jgi:hypothetical protein
MFITDMVFGEVCVFVERLCHVLTNILTSRNVTHTLGKFTAKPKGVT